MPPWFTEGWMGRGKYGYWTPSLLAGQPRKQVGQEERLGACSISGACLWLCVTRPPCPLHHHQQDQHEATSDHIVSLLGSLM
jgi:hypothetical protein